MSTTKKVLVSVTSYLTKHSVPFILGILSSVLLSTELAIFAVFGLIFISGVYCCTFYYLGMRAFEKIEY